MSTRSALLVADASPIIFLSGIGQLDLLHRVAGRVLTTETVSREVGTALPTWITIVPDPLPEHHPAFAVRLDPGERSAIALALSYGDRELLIDERAGRREATRLGLPIVGTLGILRRAKLAGLVVTVRPLIGELTQTGFRASPKLLADFLESCGE